MLGVGFYVVRRHFVLPRIGSVTFGPTQESGGRRTDPSADSQSEPNGGGLHPLAGIDRVIHAPARLMVMTYLYVVASADFVFLPQLTGLTWGNLSSHLGKLEEEGYVTIEKTFVKKKSHTMIRLTDRGRTAFREYKRGLQQVLEDLPD